MSTYIAHSIVRIYFWLGHLYYEPKCGGVNLQVIHLNIQKNYNIYVGLLCWVVVFTMSCECVNLLNLFFYVCGEFTPKTQTKSITSIVKKAYDLYFGCKVGDQTRAGHHIHVPVDVCDVYVTGSLALTSQCLLQSIWCAENRRIILSIATFV